MKLPQFTIIVGALAMILILSSNSAWGYAIPSDQLDETKVYYGSSGEFENPAEVRYQDLIKATPEYRQVKEENIERGTGKYWVLLSKASDRVNSAIRETGEDTDYDLIASAGYLESLEPSVSAEDITDLIIERMSESLEGR